MVLSENQLNNIKKMEGLSLIAYKCPAGVWSIGYGNTHYANGIKVKEGDLLSSETEAESLLIMELQRLCRNISSCIRVKIEQYQLEALVMLSYNIGLSAVINSSILRKINERKSITVDDFTAWKYARINGELKVMQGLLNRRIIEHKRFMGLDDKIR